MLSIYLITTVLSWISVFSVASELKDTYKKREYERVDQTLNLSEIIKYFKRPAILLCIPGINILIGILAQIRKEELIEEIIIKNIYEGELVHSDIIDVEVTDYPIEDNQREVIIEAIGSEKAFSDFNSMTTEEKLRVLESEREFLLREKENKTPEYENNMGEYKKDM